MFRRLFFHALRNQLPLKEWVTVEQVTENASDQAIKQVKTAMLSIMSEDPSLDSVGKMEKWGDILEVLVDFSILLREMPIDLNKLPPTTKEMIEMARAGKKP